MSHNSKATRFSTATLTAIAACSMLWLTPSTISAASITWTGNAGNGLWPDGANWSSNNAPTTNDIVTLSENVLFDTPTGNAYSLNLNNASTLTLNSGTLTVASNNGSQILSATDNSNINIHNDATLDAQKFNLTSSNINLDGSSTFYSRYNGTSQNRSTISSGTISLTDNATANIETPILEIGAGNGTGNLNLSGNSTFNFNTTHCFSIYLAYDAASTGTINLSDTATFNMGADDTLYIGRSGTGTVNVSDNATLNVPNQIYLGYYTGAVGNLNFTNYKTADFSTTHFYLGREGTGNLTLSGASTNLTFNNSTLHVAETSTANATITVKDNATMTITGHQTIMGNSSGGVGNLTLQSGGTLKAIYGLSLYNGNVNISDATLITNAPCYFYDATINLQNATINDPSDSESFQVGSGSTITGTATFNANLLFGADGSNTTTLGATEQFVVNGDLKTRRNLTLNHANNIKLSDDLEVEYSTLNIATDDALVFVDDNNPNTTQSVFLGEGGHIITTTDSLTTLGDIIEIEDLGSSIKGKFTVRDTLFLGEEKDEFACKNLRVNNLVMDSSNTIAFGVTKFSASGISAVGGEASITSDHAGYNSEQRTINSQLIVLAGGQVNLDNTKLLISNTGAKLFKNDASLSQYFSTFELGDTFDLIITEDNTATINYTGDSNQHVTYQYFDNETAAGLLGKIFYNSQKVYLEMVTAKTEVPNIPSTGKAMDQLLHAIAPGADNNNDIKQALTDILNLPTPQKQQAAVQSLQQNNVQSIASTSSTLASSNASAMHSRFSSVSQGQLFAFNPTSNQPNQQLADAAQEPTDYMLMLSTESNNNLTGSPVFDWFNRHNGGIFLTSSFTHTDHDSTANQVGFESYQSDFLIGSDFMATENLRLGAAIGYAYVTTDNLNSLGSSETNALNTQLYANYYASPNLRIDLTAGYTYADYQLERNLFSGKTAFGNTHNHQFTAEAGINYLMPTTPVKNLVLTPFAYLRYVNSNIAGYTETKAGPLGLKVDSQSSDSLTSSLGATASFKYELSNSVLEPFISASYEHQFIDQDRSSTVSFIGDPSNPFKAFVDGTDENYVNLSIGSLWAVSDKLMFRATFDTALFHDELESQRLSAGFRFNF